MAEGGQSDCFRKGGRSDPRRVWVVRDSAGDRTSGRRRDLIPRHSGLRRSQRHGGLTAVTVQAGWGGWPGGVPGWSSRFAWAPVPQAAVLP